MAYPVDGTIVLDVDEKFMTAHLSITEAKNGGVPVTLQMIKDALTNKGVRRFVREAELTKMLDEHIYGRSVLIAKGLPPVDGQNGYIIYHFDRKETPEMKTDEFGNVDYRDLGTIQNISEGTVIGDIFPETPGTPGMDIRGVELKQYAGKPAKVVTGNGIALTDDEQHLVAAISGNLRWNKSYFVVDKDVTISGDVDVSVGNIDFIGDVIIKGNINESFSVKAEGNISVFGNVTGAQVFAKGNLSVRLGIVSSTVDVEGNITANFCENSTITSKGEISVQSFVGCTVFCSGKLTAKGGKAAIVGGKYTCLSDIEANYIGSDAYIRTLITLGNVAVLAEERIDIIKRLKELEGQLTQLELICNSLVQQKKAGGLTREREEMLSTSVKAKYTHMRTIKELHTRIEEIEKEIDNTNDLRVIVRRCVYPGVTVRINSSQLILSQQYSMCTIRMNEEREIVIG